MSLVAGEDSESDEEINTDQLLEAKRAPVLSKAGVVVGEDDEEDGKQHRERRYQGLAMKHLGSHKMEPAFQALGVGGSQWNHESFITRFWGVNYGIKCPEWHLIENAQ